MNIEVLYFEGCPNHPPVVDRLKNVLRQEGLRAQIHEIKVQGEFAAKALNFFGSPTIRVNGLDIEADARDVSQTGFACRRYSGGLPSEEMIRSTLREATRQRGSEHMIELTDASGGRCSGNRRAMVASFAAIASIVAASSCCLPILPFVVAAGFAGASAFLSATRPYLLAISILFITYGFYHAWQAKKCRRRPSLIATALLWVSALFVLTSILFPQVMANATANLLAR